MAAEGGATPKKKVPKQFSERAKAAAIQAQVADDQLRANLEAQFTLMKAKRAGQARMLAFTGAQLDSQAQAAADREFESGRQAQEEPVGPAINPVSLPGDPNGQGGAFGSAGASGVYDNIQNGMGGPGGVADPSRVSGGGGVQAGARGPQGPQGPQTPGDFGGPPGGGYTAPDQLQNTIETSRNVPIQWQGGLTMAPQNGTERQTMDNRLTGAQAAQLNQNALFEQIRVREATKAANRATAFELYKTWGNSAGPLAARVLAGHELRLEDLQKAGSTLEELRIRADIEQSGSTSQYYRDKSKYEERDQDRADKVFEMTRLTTMAELAKTLNLTGGEINEQNLPLNDASGISLGMINGNAGTDDLLARVEAGKEKYGRVVTGLADNARDTDPTKFYLEMGAPAQALNQVIVQDVQPLSDFQVGMSKLGEKLGKKPIRRFPIGLTTVPLVVFLAEWELAKGMVPTADKERVKEAKIRLAEWGYTEAHSNPTGNNRFMKYYWNKTDDALKEYVGTKVENDALALIGMRPVVDPKMFRPGPAERVREQKREIEMERKMKHIKSGFGYLKEMQDEAIKQLGLPEAQPPQTGK